MADGYEGNIEDDGDMRVLGKNRSQVPPPYGHWSYVEWVFSSSHVSATQRPMKLLLRGDGRFSGRFVFERAITFFAVSRESNGSAMQSGFGG